MYMILSVFLIPADELMSNEWLVRIDIRPEGKKITKKKLFVKSHAEHKLQNINRA